MKTIEQLKAEIKAAEENKLLKKVLENNLKAVIYSDDVIKDVINAFNKYAGKKIGERTLEKINADLQKIYPDIRVYFDHRSYYDGTRTGLRIYRNCTFPELDHDNNDIIIQHKIYDNRNLFDDNSAFKGLDINDIMKIGRPNYIEDITGYVNEKTKQFQAIQEIGKKYDDLVKAFRVNGVRGLTDFQCMNLPYSITK